MKTKLLSLCAFFLILTQLQIPTFSKTTIDKEEVVYSRLNLDGTVESIFVVNSFDVHDDKSTIIDYGRYQEVINTTNHQEIDYDGIKAKIKDVEAGRFFYHGELVGSTQLPWLLQIKYFLDNQEISPHDLGGKSGKLRIEITSKQNKNIDPVYFDNYLLNVTLNMDSKLATNIDAPDATIGNAGDLRTIVFTGLPKQDAKFVIKTEVTDFELAPIQIAALPFSMAIEMPDISEFTGGISQLQDGIAQLNFGASQLASGINTLNQNGGSLKAGANQLSSGASDLSFGMDQTANGSVQLTDGLRQYTGGVNELASGSQQLVDGSSQIKDGINLMATSLNDYSSMLQLTPEQQALVNSLVSALENLKTFLEDDLGSAVFLPIAESLKRDNVLALFPDLDTSNPDVDRLLNYMQAQATAIENSYNLLAPFQQSIKQELLPKIDSMISMISGISQIGQLISGVNELNNQYQLFHSGLEQLADGLSQLDQNSGQLVSGSQELSSGLQQLNAGVSEFKSGVDQYSSGINQYTDGVSQLSSGANQLSSGTNQLEEGTSDIDSLMAEKIEELMEDYEFEDFEMKSFVDDRNKNTELVQFVFMTQPISIPEEVEEVIIEEEEKSFWDLFLDLFK